MVTITCSESGIEFEAQTKRTKQHPLIAELKAVANKNRTYREVNEALREVRKAGGYETIEEFMSLIEANLQAKRDKANERAKRFREMEAKEAEKEAIRKAEKEAQNAKLREHGYKWERVAIGTEDAPGSYGSYGAGIGEFSHYQWILFAPDRRVVSAGRAMEEIGRGAETIKQEEIQAKQEADRKASAEQAEKDAVEKKFNRRKKFAESKTEVENIAYEAYKDFETVAFYRSSQMTTHHVKEGWINGVRCYVVSTFGDMDFSRYYSDYPEKAGLKPASKTQNDMEDYF